MRSSRLIAVAEAEGIRVISDEIYHGLDYAFAAETAANLSARARGDQFVLEIFLHDRLARRLDGGAGEPGARDRALAGQSRHFGADACRRSRRSRPSTAQREMEAVKHGYEENRRILVDGLPKAGLDKFLPVDGAFYLYADISRFSNDSLDFAKRMLEEAHVAATPGIDFDPVNGHNFLRFCYAGSAPRCTKRWSGSGSGSSGARTRRRARPPRPARPWRPRSIPASAACAMIVLQ